MQTPYLSLKVSIFFTLLFIGLLWLLKLLETMTGLSLAEFGIYPNKLTGMPGILLAPLIHGSFAHLAANTLPLLLLGSSLLHTYPRAAVRALPIIYLVSGTGVWLFARSSYHFGASGLTHGMAFFIFTMGVLRRDRLPIALSMIVFFLYGSMIYSIFPTQPGVSFEYHFWGAACGFSLAFFLKNLDPAMPKKKYDWEDDSEDEEDPIIGDEWRQL